MLLLFIGINSIYVAFRNQTPTNITVGELSHSGPSAKWLRVTDGILDPTRALIANSAQPGEIKEAYLPLVRSIEDVEIDVIVLTKDSSLLELINEHQRIIITQNKEAGNAYFESRLREFEVSRDVLGMASSYNEMGSRTRRKLKNAYKDLAELPVLIEEGKSPSKSGPLVLALGIIFAILFVYYWCRSLNSKSNKPQPPPLPNAGPPPIPH